MFNLKRYGTFFVFCIGLLLVVLGGSLVLRALGILVGIVCYLYYEHLMKSLDEWSDL